MFLTYIAKLKLLYINQIYFLHQKYSLQPFQVYQCIQLFQTKDQIYVFFYHLDHKQFYPSPAFQGQFDFSKLRDHDELYKQIKENKFTHIITLFKPNELILNSYEKINSTNFLENYNKLFNNLILEYCTNIYESEIVNIMQSRTLNLGSYERTLLLYQIN